MPDATTDLTPTNLIASLFPVGAAARAGNIADAPQSPFDVECATVETAVDSRRQEFFAGRALAREALAAFGEPAASLPRSGDRTPVWPAGFVGSISHGDGLCCAVVARDRDFAALGVDVESAAPLSAPVIERVCCKTEIARFERQGAMPAPVWAKLAFSAKEAIYKAWFPLTRRTLGFQDVDVRFEQHAGDVGSFVVSMDAAQSRDFQDRLIGRWRIASGRVHTGVYLPA